MNLNLISTRRNGTVIVYVALALVVLLGAAGLSIDVGNLYLQRDKAQRAADAAALAGALQLMQLNGVDAANDAAHSIAAANGYDATKGATVKCSPQAEGNDAWYRVYVSKPAPVFFMAIFGWRYKTIGAPATATYRTAVNIDINGGGEYGANGPVSLSLFGPDGRRANGDRYSTMYIDNNKPRGINPYYDPAGYDFNLSIPKDYASVNGTSEIGVQIFDPDCYNVNSGQNAQAGVSVDEMRGFNGENVNSSSKYLTTTRYTLYDTKGTVSKDDDVQIAQASYGGDSKSDMAWVTPTGFKFDISKVTLKGDVRDLRINVKSTSGSSENGFNLRAGPPLYSSGSIVDVREKGVGENTQYKKIVNGKETGNWLNKNPFNSKNGTNITATGRIPMNFNADGQATITLGYVPAKAVQVTINKFDTDVGSNMSVTYNDGISTRTGKLSGNDEDAPPDVYDLGNDYPGGLWTATYKAGLGDTSVWDMSCVGSSLQTPGGVYLVK